MFTKQNIKIKREIEGSKDERIFKKEESIEILKFLDLTNDIEKYQKNVWLKKA